MNQAGRTVIIKFVMTAMVIYLAMALELPAWALKAIDKYHRGFLWRGRQEAKGGHCWHGLKSLGPWSWEDWAFMILRCYAGP